MGPSVSAVGEPGRVRDGWSLPRRLAFRFGSVYLLLFLLPVVIDLFIPRGDLRDDLYDGWGRIGAWVGAHVLGLDGPFVTQETGSGDRLVDYVLLGCFAAVAALATLVWSIVARDRREHERLERGMRVVLRYALAYIMFAYGIIKLYGGQFSVPGPGRLAQAYGDSSPMGLLWTFMGASPAYVVFAGAAETLGGVLLLFRRTATLGAILLGFVLTNVAMLNFCYDVPVKINSTHYVLVCVVLMLPDLRRLAAVLVLARPTTPPAPPPVEPRRWARIARLVLKYGVTALVVWRVHADVDDTRAFHRRYTWFQGWWEVETFQRDGVEVPPVLTDATRWRRVKFESDARQSLVRWHHMDRSYGDLFGVVADDAAGTMVWTRQEDDQPADRFTLRVTRADADHVRLEGTIEGHALVVTMARMTGEQTLLRRRGFHWVNDYPYNR